MEDGSHPLRAKTSAPFPSKSLRYSLRNKIKYVRHNLHILKVTYNKQCADFGKESDPTNASANASVDSRPTVDRLSTNFRPTRCPLELGLCRQFHFDIITGNKHYATLGRIVRSRLTLTLKFNEVLVFFIFLIILFYFTCHIHFKRKTINRKPHRKATKIKTQFSLVLG